MKFNMDFSQRILINTESEEWTPSPMNGVLRKPLEREAMESGHTTSVVKYEAGAKFNSHFHPLGEEIFVLDGVFSDEHGDYPAGTYLRNPPNSTHAPFSNQGCVLFVKLNQFALDDNKIVRINTLETNWHQGQGRLQVMPLHEHNGLGTALVKWPAGEHFVPHRHWGGEEIFVLSGEFCDEFGKYPKGSWLRSPHQSTHYPFVEEETIIFVKTGHLLID